jgi:hypothetical protein
LSTTQELEVAFNAALTHVEHSIAADLKTMDGESARPHLEKLKRELTVQRDEAVKRGSVDRAWFQRTVRWVTEWIPDTEITLIAALGRIVRVAPPALS